MTPTRDEMVDLQVAGRGVTNRRVLDAMRAVPRELFVPPHLRRHAYADRPLPIGDDQTISQPLVVATMAELAAIPSDGVVLEVGAGCGYQAAVLSHLARRVFAVEIRPALAAQARANLAEVGVDNVSVLAQDGGYGLPEHAPFDAIIISAAAADAPAPLLAQLADGGRLVAPLGTPEDQLLVCIERRGDDLIRTTHGVVRFVAFIGDFGTR